MEHNKKGGFVHRNLHIKILAMVSSREKSGKRIGTGSVRKKPDFLFLYIFTYGVVLLQGVWRNWKAPHKG